MPTTPPFTSTFEIMTEDLVDYLRVAQRTLNSVGMGAGIIGVLYGIYLAYLGDTVLGAVLVGMAVFLFLASATRYADRLRSRSIGKRVIGSQATYTIDDGGIDSSTVAGHAHVPWSAADNFLESPEVIVLRRGKMTVMWLPKRAMGSPAERDALLDFLRSHVSAVGPSPR